MTKTAVAWIEYYADGKDSVVTCEYDTFGDSGTYETLADFLNALKKLSVAGGYKLQINSVVVG